MKSCRVLFSVVLVFILSLHGCKNPATGHREDTASTFTSLEINGIPYIHGTSAPVQLLTDENFQFRVVLENKGTTTWGRDTAAGEHGASLLSRGDPSHDPNDYNETFGTFFILYPMQFGVPFGSNDPTVLPGESWEIDTLLRTPSTPGTYTMRWQAAEWPLGTSVGYHITETSQTMLNNPNNYFNRPFFGSQVVVNIVVSQRQEQAPVPIRKAGVLDASDFEYMGSFRLPRVWTSAQNNLYGHEDSKAHVESGITLRRANGELRMLAVTGTNANRLYEIAVPEDPVKIVGTNTAALPIAELTLIYGGESNLFQATSNAISPTWNQGSMWLDNTTNTLYWTNIPTYLASVSSQPSASPSAYYAKIDFENGLVYDRKEWYRSSWDDAPRSSFFQGVTGIPHSLTHLFGGRQLAFGFGGGPSVNNYSPGPTLAVVSVATNGAIQNDFQPLMYKTSSTTGETHAEREGNYFALSAWDTNPTSPWEGKFLYRDYVRSGIFIDYNGKRAYMTFVHQVKNRVAYDFGGALYFGRSQNSWYFYDVDDLASADEPTGLKPSSYSVVNYPSSHIEKPYESRVSGSCFDPETGMLYLYVRRANDRDPLVHVYKVN